ALRSSGQLRRWSTRAHVWSDALHALPMQRFLDRTRQCTGLSIMSRRSTSIDQVNLKYAARDVSSSVGIPVSRSCLSFGLDSPPDPTQRFLTAERVACFRERSH